MKRETDTVKVLRQISTDPLQPAGIRQLAQAKLEDIERSTPAQAPRSEK